MKKVVAILCVALMMGVSSLSLVSCNSSSSTTTTTANFTVTGSDSATGN